VATGQVGCSADLTADDCFLSCAGMTFTPTFGVCLDITSHRAAEGIIEPQRQDTSFTTRCSHVWTIAGMSFLVWHLPWE